MRLHRLRQNKGRHHRLRKRKLHLHPLNLGTELFAGQKTGKSQRDVFTAPSPLGNHFMAEDNIVHFT
jgi:hypothetical protein